MNTDNTNKVNQFLLELAKRADQNRFYPFPDIFRKSVQQVIKDSKLNVNSIEDQRLAINIALDLQENKTTPVSSIDDNTVGSPSNTVGSSNQAPNVINSSPNMSNPSSNMSNPSPNMSNLSPNTTSSQPNPTPGVSNISSNKPSVIINKIFRK